MKALRRRPVAEPAIPRGGWACTRTDCVFRKSFWQAMETLEIQRTLDPGFQSSAITAHANSLCGCGQARKRPISADFSPELLTPVCRPRAHLVSLRPFLSKAHDYVKLVRNF